MRAVQTTSARENTTKHMLNMAKRMGGTKTKHLQYEINRRVSKKELCSLGIRFRLFTVVVEYEREFPNIPVLIKFEHTRYLIISSKPECLLSLFPFPSLKSSIRRRGVSLRNLRKLFLMSLHPASVLR